MEAMVIPVLLTTVCAVIDIRKRTLPLWLLAAGGAAGIAAALYMGGITFYGMLVGLTLGTAILLFSILSGEKLGRGDAVLFMALGGSLGIWRVLLLMWMSFLAAGIFGIAMMIFAHRDKNSELPFVPFLGLSVLVMAAAEIATGNVV